MKLSKNTFGALPDNIKSPTVEGDGSSQARRGAGRSRVMDGSVKEGPDCVVTTWSASKPLIIATLDKKSPPRASFLQTRSISSSFADNNMGSHHDFSTKLFGLLVEEARCQADRETDRETDGVFGDLYMEVETGEGHD